MWNKNEQRYKQYSGDIQMVCNLDDRTSMTSSSAVIEAVFLALAAIHRYRSRGALNLWDAGDRSKGAQILVEECLDLEGCQNWDHSFEIDR